MFSRRSLPPTLHITTALTCGQLSEDAYKVSETLIAAQAYQPGILFISWLCMGAPLGSV